jgi:hypothetical protein
MALEALFVAVMQVPHPEEASRSISRCLYMDAPSGGGFLFDGCTSNMVSCTGLRK